MDPRDHVVGLAALAACLGARQPRAELTEIRDAGEGPMIHLTNEGRQVAARLQRAALEARAEVNPFEDLKTHQLLTVVAGAMGNAAGFPRLFTADLPDGELAVAVSGLLEHAAEAGRQIG